MVTLAHWKSAGFLLAREPRRQPWGGLSGAIVRAIRAARVMVLVFSQNANNSDEIKTRP